MNRLLYHPLARAADMDAGGAADLQTDIMRFMAILALCLVAIFALVQSISLEPLKPVSTPTPPGSVTEPAAVQPVQVPPPVEPAPPTQTQEPAPPQPAPGPSPEQIREITWRDLIPKRTQVAKNTPNQSTQAPVPPAPPPEPAARELAEAPVPTPTPPAPASSSRQAMETSRAASPSANEVDPVEEVPAAPANVPAREGFTLRFESDAALTRLVARNEIGLYAIGEKKSLRMSVNRGTVSFWPASAPNQFHEMEASTVPAEVIAALRRSGSFVPVLGPDPVGSGPDSKGTALGPHPTGSGPKFKWGVTLPTGMRQQLNGYLAEHTGGALVIEGDGNLRLEP